jgi:hypothetical protein
MNKRTNECFIVNQDAHNEQYNHSIQLIHILLESLFLSFPVKSVLQFRNKRYQLDFFMHHAATNYYGLKVPAVTITVFITILEQNR